MREHFDEAHTHVLDLVRLAASQKSEPLGTDGHDDGGDSALNSEATSYREIWNGRDAVWPKPATPANADEAMQWTKD